MPDRDFLLRVGVFRLVVGGLFLILVGNLFGMMVLRHDYYQGQALENRQERFRVRAPRGRIFDREGKVLADNLYIADIVVPRGSVTEDGPDSTLARLMTWFDLPPAETVERLVEQKRRSGPLVLVRNASMAQISAVEERGRELPGVRVRARARRRYLHGPLFAHVIGYVGEVGQADLDTTGDWTGYRPGDSIGKQGLEASLESVLRGTSGVKLEEVNASGRVVGREAVWLREVEPGTDVTLAISLHLQEVMAAAIGDRPACGVALDTETGQVLAAYSNPTFDPNLMTVSISTDQWRQLTSDPAKPFFNRVVQATYPPASLYKPVTSLAALQHRLVGRETYLEPCLGGWEFGNRYFRCWLPTGHGDVDHTEAIVRSCDTFYYQLALRLDLEQLGAAARAFGLGRTCTRLFSDEVAGNVPDTEYYDRRFGEGRWTRGVMLNNAIGQGELLVTPIQMAVLAGRLATSGRMPDPEFVLLPPEPTQRPAPLPFREADLAWVRDALIETVDRGTGKQAGLEGIPVAGKTGTAQNPHGADHAWFMCFAPADAPEVAVAVIIENAGHGSTEAAPVAGTWLEAYFRGTGRLAPAGSEGGS
ncbi:penicillin-binding protein 2 [bacterium]|nr:penicillin-binding protein 2 [bacterium]